MRGIWRILRWTGVALIASLALAWLGDYVSVEHRMAHKTSTDPVESMIVRPVYAVARKDGKDEFDFGDPQTHTCIHSLFPHFGYSPCWYVIRQSQKAIPIGILVPMVAIPMVAILVRSDALGHDSRVGCRVSCKRRSVIFGIPPNRPTT